jgi:hypothetical protein
MSARFLLSMLSLACAGAIAAEAAPPPKFTPEIQGQLSDGKRPVPSTNVCLRQGGSEIRACGYTDFDGRFLIPSSGPMHSAPLKVGADGASAYPTYWLEMGRVTSARKLAQVDLVGDKVAAIAVDCDVSRVAAGNDTPSGVCTAKPARSVLARRVSDSDAAHLPARAAPRGSK